MGSRVLVLGAHPDDEVACAGTISRYLRDGATVRLITFSACQDLNGPGLISEWNYANRRLRPELLNIPNRRFPEFRQQVLDRLDAERNWHDIVFCPSPNDAHQDHATVAQEARRVFKGVTILGYELTPNQMTPVDNRAYIKLTEVDVEYKMEHAAMYRTQKAEAYMDDDYLRSLAKVRGVQAEAEWAEAFEVIRWVI